MANNKTRFIAIGTSLAMSLIATQALNAASVNSADVKAPQELANKQATSPTVLASVNLCAAGCSTVASERSTESSGKQDRDKATGKMKKGKPSAKSAKKSI